MSLYEIDKVKIHFGKDMKKFILVALLVLISLPLYSKNGDASLLPGMIGANNAGKEFWFSVPPCFESDVSYPNLIKIYVTSNVKTLVTVEVPGKGYFKASYTLPNDVIDFSITSAQGQPFSKNPTDENVAETVFQNAGIYVYADDPIIVYCVVRYRVTTEGFMVIPVSSLGREYIVAGHPVDAMFRAINEYKMPCVTTVTAPFDDTKIRFTLGGTAFTKTKGGMKPGEVKEWSLMKGDVFAISADTDEGDLSGSKVVSTKPVAVTTGNMLANIPTGNVWGGYTAEMDMPTFTWGKNIHVGKIPYRKYASIIRVFAKEPNTKIFRNGKNIGTIATSGGILGKGFMEMRMTQDGNPGSVVISSDQPISVTLYNTGVQEDGEPLPKCAPFVMSSIPVEQYQKEIFFCTPRVSSDSNSGENYVNLVYETDSLGMMPDDMEIAGPVHGEAFVWKKVWDEFPGMDELFKYDVNGKKYALKTIQLTGNGVYSIRSKTPFAAYGFGFDSLNSYGYPLSAALATMEELTDTLPPVPKYTRCCCDGNITDGVVTDMPEDKAIRSNLSTIVFQSDVSFNYVFKYVDFIPGDTRTTNWILQVVDPLKDAQAVITFADRRGNDTTIKINYYAPKYTIRPNPVDFGIIKIGEEKTVDFHAINISSESAVIIEFFNLASSPKGFSLTGPSVPFIIPPNDSINFQVKFTATTGGTFKNSISIADSCHIPTFVFLTATVEYPIIYVTNVNYYPVTTGNTATKEFQITNEGTLDLTITGYTGPSNNVFTTSLPYIDASNPWILLPKESKTIMITFNPTSIGKFTDRITFISDADTNRKNYCLINGEASIPGLKANSYDWFNRKINGTYPPDNDEKVITLLNDGADDVTISGIKIVSYLIGESFEFDKDKFTGMVIKKSESAYVPVVFHPVQTGQHELIIFYNNTSGSSPTTVLRGYGTLLNSITDLFNSGINIITQNEQLLIELPENTSGDFSVSIFDLKGTQVYAKKDIPATFSNRIIIDCGAFVNGTYLLNLASGDKYYIKKFVIYR